eukprot:4813911-Prorocentrum_lima.AAC.1
METMRRHGIAAMDEVAMIKQSMVQAEIEKKKMIVFVEQAELKAAEEDRMRQQVMAEAQNLFRNQEQSIQKEKGA